MRIAVVAAALLAPSLAAGEGIDILDGLADLIAAEAFCGLRYDQQAIETFIAQTWRPTISNLPVCSRD